MLNIGWFSTGRGEGSRGLLNFVQKRLTATGADARINFVFSNRERGEAEGSDEFFNLVDGYDITLVTGHYINPKLRRMGAAILDPTITALGNAHLYP